MRLTNVALPALVASTLFFLSGCASVTGSVESSSDSGGGSVEALKSPFDSSSGSSGSGGSSLASSNYRRDVGSYTTAYFDDVASEGEYLRGLAQIAGLHGITDWETDENTLVAIRATVAEGHLDGGAVARLRIELAPLGEDVLQSTLAGQP